MLQELFSTVPTITADALEAFDAAEAVEPEFMIGTWHGAELPTGHPMDGLLAASGWWGKQFIDAETVHPLLFPARDSTGLWALNPALAFGGLGLSTKLPLLRNRSMVAPIAALRPVLQTRSAKARLRTTRYRGVDTATMIYDQLPINDVFRKLSDDAVIGAMDLRGSRKPYFFVLRRDDSRRLA
ncbi:MULTISPECIES: DUF4334 domain-containing protein [Mycolicibacterium]|uniref:DUF4334 domain-containing protein n=1 Tax=Mycolicibacterium wolinskyi TaxID=59750 RepID=A0A1X2EWR3_9MYCO|nr:MULTISPECIES: DUF4334 domain-containing protein [Mycolicibacterium]MCV7289990.1 DUF4334 domain-containing protein [Mycolicibacterium wolinskyi]MCV7293025.1 DUF4334 domain-containing protein [Mycolicibacterium goodii]ORX10632.1 hypothetical protein AWC31_04930 [Mycolicibacterium wolinskyi]